MTKDLRSVYRKLDIRSRVDLTRVALAHQYELLHHYELTGR
jgi:DNA-binding CsgD family transcriptional regulator